MEVADTKRLKPMEAQDGLLLAQLGRQVANAPAVATVSGRVRGTAHSVIWIGLSVEPGMIATLLYWWPELAGY